MNAYMHASMPMALTIIAKDTHVVKGGSMAWLPPATGSQSGVDAYEEDVPPPTIESMVHPLPLSKHARNQPGWVNTSGLYQLTCIMPTV